MRRWQTWLVMGVLCSAGSSVVQAQSLFERLEQAFSADALPAATPEATDVPAQPRTTEDLPPPPARHAPLRDVPRWE